MNASRDQQLEITKTQFVNPEFIEIETKIHWINPVPVGEFEISDEATKTGHIRHLSTFKKFREDKSLGMQCRRSPGALPRRQRKRKLPQRFKRNRQGRTMAPHETCRALGRRSRNARSRAERRSQLKERKLSSRTSNGSFGRGMSPD